MSELTTDEITILSATDVELYAYIRKASLGKKWPSEIVRDGVIFEYEAQWNLPTQMKSFIQAARYLKA